MLPYQHIKIKKLLLNDFYLGKCVTVPTYPTQKFIFKLFLSGIMCCRTNTSNSKKNTFNFFIWRNVLPYQHIQIKKNSLNYFYREKFNAVPTYPTQTIIFELFTSGKMCSQYQHIQLKSVRIQYIPPLGIYINEWCHCKVNKFF